jgi:ABC-type transport system involved in Fe-S cluster assembly fused permease/ATPase subunit
MDEPSSALDPAAESAFYQNIMDNAGGKAIIIISHRLSTTMTADAIIMMDGGRIIEKGNHKELLALGGKYAEMWDYQARKYKEHTT